jgi:flavin-dependent dehydrogenase
MQHDFDVVVVGGGPGGSACAARLASHGRRVLVLEKARHPRFHLGESLLPQSLPVFDELGLRETIEARFIVKNGANFHEDETGKTCRYDFGEAYDASRDHAFQVPRDDFDEMLFRHAAARGADAREGWTVTKVEAGLEGARVSANDPHGKAHAFSGRFVVDATGRDAMVLRERTRLEKIEGLDKTALFTQYRGVWRGAGREEGDIQIVCAPYGWFWYIPFKDGRTSVGVVVSSAWIREARDAGVKGAPELFARAVEQSRVMPRLLAGGERLFPPGAMADFSFSTDRLAGDGWMAVGDAGGFIDPLFSTGAHLALRGGVAGADAIHAALEAGDTSAARFVAWEAFVRRGADTFIGAVRAFYRGTLIPYLFADKQHPYLRRAITSMLAGDVFDEDARWVRDMRTRFPARAEPA